MFIFEPKTWSEILKEGIAIFVEVMCIKTYCTQSDSSERSPGKTLIGLSGMLEVYCM